MHREKVLFGGRPLNILNSKNNVNDDQFPSSNLPEVQKSKLGGKTHASKLQEFQDLDLEIKYKHWHVDVAGREQGETDDFGGK